MKAFRFMAAPKNKPRGRRVVRGGAGSHGREGQFITGHNHPLKCLNVWYACRVQTFNRNFRPVLASDARSYRLVLSGDAAFPVDFAGKHVERLALGAAEIALICTNNPPAMTTGESNFVGDIRGTLRHNGLLLGQRVAE